MQIVEVSYICGMLQSWSVKVCISISIYCYFNKIQKIVFLEMEKNFPTISFFLTGEV